MSAIPDVSLLLYSNYNIAVAASHAIAMLLNEADSADYVWLDEEVRHFLNWNLQGGSSDSDWSSLLAIATTADAQIAVYGIGSYHPRGHIRQQAVMLLGELEDARAIPFLLLRLNDWVAQVRDSARLALSHQIERGRLDGFWHHLPLVMRLLDCRRDHHRDFVNSVLENLWRDGDAQLVNTLFYHRDRKVRRYGYRELFLLSLADRRAIIQSAFRAEDPVLRLWAVRDAVAHLEQADLQEILVAARLDRFAPVRRQVLAGFVARVEDAAQQELKVSLLDPSAAVRDFARFHLRKYGQQDFSAYYRRAIDESAFLREALAGLGETGSHNDLSVFRRFARSESRRLREIAVRGIGFHSANDGREDLLRAIQDDCKKVSRAAKQALIDNPRGLTMHDLELVIKTNNKAHVRKAAAEVADSLGFWKSIPLLVTLAGDEDEAVSAAAQQLVLRRVNRVFTSPSAQERDHIELALRQCEVGRAKVFAAQCRTWLGALTGSDAVAGRDKDKV